jgi:hypothetical protein
VYGSLGLAVAMLRLSVLFFSGTAILQAWSNTLFNHFLGAFHQPWVGS